MKSDKQVYLDPNCPHIQSHFKMTLYRKGRKPSNYALKKILSIVFLGGVIFFSYTHLSNHVDFYGLGERFIKFCQKTTGFSSQTSYQLEQLENESTEN